MSALSLLWKLPASWLYGIGVRVHNLLYDWNIRQAQTVSVPTICVGNLTVGGTGKTPHIEWLIRRLSPMYRVAVVSRGYKRKTRGFVLASDSSTVADIGDECMQLHRKFPTLPIAVSEDRVEGIRRLVEICPKVQLVLLDDAFQHRRLQCDCNLLLTTADRLYATDHLLPWGHLRDNRCQSRRAHAIIVTKCPKTMTALDRRNVSRTLHLLPYQHLSFSETRYVALPDSVRNLPDNASVLLVTGIARPDYLLQHLQQRFTNIRMMAFADHHAFSPGDLMTIEKAAAAVDVVLTTEKDAARMEGIPLSDELKCKLHPIGIEAVPMDEDELLSFITKHIRHAYSNSTETIHTAI